MTKPSLNDRIAGILTRDATSQNIVETLDAAKAELAAVRARRADAELIAVDPLADSRAVKDADASIAKIDLEERRLVNAIERLEQQLTERLDVEREASKLATYLEIEAERDAVVEAIRNDYPAALAILIPLVERIHRSDVALEKVNRALPAGKRPLAYAESVARGWKAGTMHPTIVGHMKLPKPTDDYYCAYPKVDANGYQLRG